MKTDIYKYKNYVKYLKTYIENKSKIEKSLKLKIAEHVGCHPSYLSQVLSGKVNFNLEQGIKLNKFLAHSKDESKYFLWLIELARAGTPELKKFFKEQISELQNSRLDLKNRLNNIETISHEHQYKYYSSWVYSAIYVAISIPEINEASQLAKNFNLPIDLVHDAISYLKNIGLIVELSGKLQVTKKTLHLSRDNEFIQRHHINWRSKSLQSVEVNLKDDLHYSSVLAIHSKDFIKLKEHYINCIAESKKIIAPSKEEKVYAFTLDLFKL